MGVADGPDGGVEEDDQDQGSVTVRVVRPESRSRAVPVHRVEVSPSRREGQEAPMVITPRMVARLIRQIRTSLRKTRRRSTSS
jgi:hypothetical protein